MTTPSTKPRGPITLLMTSRRFRLGAAIVLPLWLYLGSYCLLLERKIYYQTGVDPATGQNLFEIEPRYRLSEPWVEPAMRPAHWIDRHVRYDYWTTIKGTDGRKWKNPK